MSADRWNGFGDTPDDMPAEYREPIDQDEHHHPAPSDFSEQEIRAAQFDLDHQPNFSTYWESRAGQEALEVARVCRLRAATTDAYRREWYRAQMVAA